MDEDAWRIHGKYKAVRAMPKVGIRPIALADTLAGFFLLAAGLVISCVAFTLEFVWNRQHNA